MYGEHSVATREVAVAPLHPSVAEPVSVYSYIAYLSTTCTGVLVKLCTACRSHACNSALAWRFSGQVSNA